MRSSPDSHALASHPLAAQGPHQVKHSTEIWLKVEWKDTRAVWYGSGGGVPFFFLFFFRHDLSDRVLSEISGMLVQPLGYFTGLETGIISQQPSVWNECAAIFSMCQSNLHRGKRRRGRAFKQKIPQSGVFSVFFFSPLPFTLILPSILTSLCLPVIHAHPPPHLSPSPSHGPFIPPSVTRLSWGVQAGAGLTVQEVSERWPLPAVSSPHVCLMTPLSIYKANGFLAYGNLSFFFFFFR